jgi:hypothetical protein
MRDVNTKRSHQLLHAAQVCPNSSCINRFSRRRIKNIHFALFKSRLRTFTLHPVHSTEECASQDYSKHLRLAYVTLDVNPLQYCVTTGLGSSKALENALSKRRACGEISACNPALPYFI